MNPLRVCEGLLLFQSKGRGYLYFNINEGSFWGIVLFVPKTITALKPLRTFRLSSHLHRQATAETSPRGLPGVLTGWSINARTTFWARCLLVVRYGLPSVYLGCWTWIGMLATIPRSRCRLNHLFPAGKPLLLPQI
jgi:hypothetical protein